MAFDKTGTLTEEGLDLQHVVPFKNGGFGPPVDSDEVAEVLDRLVLSGMATCHSLTVINGNLCGDPLDLILFKATGWQLTDPEVLFLMIADYNCIFEILLHIKIYLQKRLN